MLESFSLDDFNRSANTKNLKTQHSVSAEEIDDAVTAAVNNNSSAEDDTSTNHVNLCNPTISSID